MRRGRRRSRRSRKRGKMLMPSLGFRFDFTVDIDLAGVDYCIAIGVL